MYNVSYKIDIGAQGFSSDRPDFLLDLETRASLDEPVNFAQIVIDSGADVTVNSGDPVKIKLGYNDSAALVFSGEASFIEQDIHRTIIEALGSFKTLTSSRFNLLYEKQTSGNIVSDLLQRLDIAKDTIEDGERFTTYMLSDGRNVWDHLKGLALYCGFDLYANAEDKTVFKRFSPKSTHELKYGIHILEFEKSCLPEMLEGIEVYGESPAGQGQGEDAASWLTKKEVKGAAGKTSGNVLRIAAPLARNQDLAKTMAQNLIKGFKTKERGSVRVLGTPQVGLCDAIKIEKMPVSSQNGTFKVTGVQHRLSPVRGFITDISWEKV